jgi:hypothetical protein
MILNAIKAKNEILFNAKMAKNEYFHYDQCVSDLLTIFL